MPRTDHFAERIGAVFLPEADVIVPDDLTSGPDAPSPMAMAAPSPVPNPPNVPIPPFKVCTTTLKEGCYTLHFVPTGAKLWSTRFRGTLRVETVANGVRTSADLYSYRILGDIITKPLPPLEVLQAASVADEAADTGGTVPIYRRRSYHSYLKGTGARLTVLTPAGAPCWFSLDFDEFVYDHPATGFSGSFNTTANRSIRYVLRKTGVPDLYAGEAFVGHTKIGVVSVRWISAFYRRADLQIHTLAGATTPPAVGASTFATIWADAGWDLRVTDNGQVPLPPELAGQDINGAWSEANLHTLMSTVAGYNPGVLDSMWRVHLVAVPARLGESRGIMFDSSLGADPNSVPREGSATFSHDGYPATDTPHYDSAANQQQRNVPRAFLRSAAHEVGHAFNQIHQGFENGNDNSIMTPTPSVATVLGLAGTFPDDINLGFNPTVKKHLRHLPDPAVRPGAMDFFGSAVSAPEAADVAWLDTAEVTLDFSTRTPALGEPVELSFHLNNAAAVPLPVPATLDTESMTVRINVTDPSGRITFLRPERVNSCPRVTLEELAPGESVSGTVTLFWGRDGFAFEAPGRHAVQVILLWNVAGVPAGASAEQELFVRYPTSDEDNDVAALFLDPSVGVAIATGTLAATGPAGERVNRAVSTARTHPAVRMVGQLGLLDQSSTGESE